MRKRIAPGPQASRKTGKQLNAVVSEDLFSAFARYCTERNLKRDRTIELALGRFLRAESDDEREFHVVLSPAGADRLRAFRIARRSPDRSLLAEDAITAYIDAVLENDLETRERYAQIATPPSRPNTN